MGISVRQYSLDFASRSAMRLLGLVISMAISGVLPICEI